MNGACYLVTVQSFGETNHLKNKLANICQVLVEKCEYMEFW